ncbi:MAG: glycosyltransferase family 2 protein [Chloroflexota bacterium]
MIDVSIVIVSWNVRELLIACIDSIISSPIAINTPSDDSPIVEIIVVDSASEDDTVAMLQRDYPQVLVFAQSENIGFTRGNNLGFEQARGRYLFMLNPDTEIIGDAIPQMINYLDNNPTVGFVGPHTLNTDRTTQSTRRRFMTKTLAFFESTWLQPYAPKSLLANYYMNEQADDAVLNVDWVQGSAIMVRRSIYEQVGGLDTSFVMFFEEQDWCKRIKTQGWDATYLGTAYVIHHGGKSTDQIGAQKHIWFQKSKLRYSHKHHGVMFASVLRIFLLLNYIMQIIIEGLKGLLGSKRELRRERIMTYWQIVRSGLKSA